MFIFVQYFINHQSKNIIIFIRNILNLTVCLHSIVNGYFLQPNSQNNNKNKMAQQQNLSQFNRFLINNQQFLQEKHLEYFSGAKSSTLSAVSIQSLIDYIYDVFSFNKYKKDQKTHKKISISLTKNIQDFLREAGPKSQQLFTSEMAVQVLTYCIQHNDMFSVQYDVEKPQKTSSQMEISHLQNSAKQQSGKETFKHQKRQEKISKDNSVITKTISNKAIKNSVDQIFVNITKLQAAIQRRHEQGNIQQQSQSSSIRETVKAQPNQFDHHQRISLSLNPDILKKNAKLAFFSFCKNQMELGGNKTFDGLEEQASTMTIGKLLVYGKAYNMFSPLVTKEFVMQRFKKISGGKRAIDFEKFYVLLAQLHIVDPQVFDRLKLMDQNLYKKLKFVKYPFYTQDQQPRQLVLNRGFANKLTSHSGMTHQDLRQVLNQRRSELRSPLSLLPSRSFSKPQSNYQSKGKQKMISPKDLTVGGRSRDFSVQLSFIDKIVSPQQNDQKYLGDYQIQHLKHRTQDTSINSSMSLRRKDSIVQNIRKRIQQIQYIQNGSASTRGRPSNAQRRYLAH